MFVMALSMMHHGDAVSFDMFFYDVFNLRDVMAEHGKASVIPVDMSTQFCEISFRLYLHFLYRNRSTHIYLLDVPNFYTIYYLENRLFPSVIVAIVLYFFLNVYPDAVLEQSIGLNKHHHH